MGLDAYIYRNDNPYDHGDRTEVFYARKNYFLDDWVRVASGEQRPLSTDYCGTHVHLDGERIEGLLRACKKVQAAYTLNGLYFDSWHETAYRHEKLDELIEALEAVQAYEVKSYAEHGTLSSYTYSSNC